MLIPSYTAMLRERETSLSRRVNANSQQSEEEIDVLLQAYQEG